MNHCIEGELSAVRAEEFCFHCWGECINSKLFKFLHL